MTHIDTKSTKVILIGVSEFQDKSFINANPIKNNVAKLKVLFQDENILGVGEKNILVFDKNERHIDILNEIEEFVEEGFTDTVIFYFAGHGYKTDEGKFYLVTNNSNRKRLHISSIPWDEIKEIIERGNSVQQRFYILDACHSGAAALGDNDEELEFEDGSAIIASAKAGSKAYFNETDQYTYFTDALINILENGIENLEEPELGVKPIFDQLDRNLKSRNFNISRTITQKIDDVTFFKNKSFDKVAILLKEGDEYFNTDNFKNAEECYKEALIEYITTSNRDEQKIEQIKNKRISARDKQKFKERIQAEYKRKQEESRKAKEQAELKRKQEEERKAKEQAEYKRKQEEARKAKELAELKRKQEEERKAKELAELKRKQEEEQKAKEQAELKRKQEEERKAKEQAELNRKQEEERKAKEQAELKQNQEEEQKAKKQAELKRKKEENRKAREQSELKSKQEEEQKAKDDAENRKNRNYQDDKIVSENFSFKPLIIGAIIAAIIITILLIIGSIN